MKPRIHPGLIVVLVLGGLFGCTANPAEPSPSPVPPSSTDPNADAAACQTVADDVIALALLPNTIDLADINKLPDMQRNIYERQEAAPSELIGPYERMRAIVQAYEFRRRDALPPTGRPTVAPTSSTSPSVPTPTSTPTATTAPAFDRAAFDSQVDELKEWLSAECAGVSIIG